MKNRFYYLVPKDYDNPQNYKNEYFVIQELETHNIEIIPIYDLNIQNINNDSSITGLLFSSLKIIWKNRSQINQFKIQKIPIFWWYFDTATTNFSRAMKVSKIAKQVSIFFNKDKQSFSKYIKSGINPIWLDQGVPKECNLIESPDYKYDISFFGSYQRVHKKRSRFLRNLNDTFNLVIYTKDEKKFLSKGFANVKPFVPIHLIAKKIAKINLVLNRNSNSEYCWSNRAHLMIGSGGFSLIENTKGLSDNYDKLNEIRINGFNHAHKHNSYQIKTQFLIKKINEFLKLK